MPNLMERRGIQEGKGKSGRVVMFDLHAPDAGSVFLTGSFNQWEKIQMQKGSDGEWLATLMLRPGFYEYKFIVDGNYTCGDEEDRTNNGSGHCVDNEFGTCNRVLRIV